VVRAVGNPDRRRFESCSLHQVNTMKGTNQIHFPAERLHIRYWMHLVYMRECYGVYVPRLGGWA
jgi:hypothetical protein